MAYPWLVDFPVTPRREQLVLLRVLPHLVPLQPLLVEELLVEPLKFAVRHHQKLRLRTVMDDPIVQDWDWLDWRHPVFLH